MITPLTLFIEKNGLSGSIFNHFQTEGFITALAAAPEMSNPNEWLNIMWGGSEQAPFANPQLLEEYANIIADLWNQQRELVLMGAWKWPLECHLTKQEKQQGEYSNAATRQLCEGLLHGWGVTKKDWEKYMPEGSTDNELLSGVLISINMLHDPAGAIQAITETWADITDPTEIEKQKEILLKQFDEIFEYMPTMLTGLAMRANQIMEQENEETQQSYKFS